MDCIFYEQLEFKSRIFALSTIILYLIVNTPNIERKFKNIIRPPDLGKPIIFTPQPSLQDFPKVRVKIT